MRRSALEYVENKFLRKDVAEFRTGDTVRVHWKVKEGDKERVQPFEGIVIRKTRGHNRATFTVRKMSYGVGVERIFPLHSPRYEKIEVLSHGDVNRNRLFYLRELRGKASRVEAEEEFTGGQAPAASPAHPAAPAAAEAKAENPAEAKEPAEKAEGKPKAKAEAKAEAKPKAEKKPKAKAEAKPKAKAEKKA
jgi:large subunit ribosomal protein L19